MAKSNAKKTASQIVSDSRKKLVETLIQKMQDGVHPVREMWNSVGMYGLPHNPISGARYQGVNLLRLLMASVEQKYEDPRWMTLKQANNQAGLPPPPLEAAIKKVQSQCCLKNGYGQRSLKRKMKMERLKKR